MLLAREAEGSEEMKRTLVLLLRWAQKIAGLDTGRYSRHENSPVEGRGKRSAQPTARGAEKKWVVDRVRATNEPGRGKSSSRKGGTLYTLPMEEKTKSLGRDMDTVSHPL
jgi:hypothetical protein